jgi:hypothetical protein
LGDFRLVVVLIVLHESLPHLIEVSGVLYGFKNFAGSCFEISVEIIMHAVEKEVEELMCVLL